MSSTT
ncbi:unnamed protein product, partial [Murine hepatitis virus]